MKLSSSWYGTIKPCLWYLLQIDKVICHYVIHFFRDIRRSVTMDSTWNDPSLCDTPDELGLNYKYRQEIRDLLYCLVYLSLSRNWRYDSGPRRTHANKICTLDLCAHAFISLMHCGLGFFPGGNGGPPVGKNLVNPPIQHSSPFSDQSLSPSTQHLSQKILYNFSTFFV